MRVLHRGPARADHAGNDPRPAQNTLEMAWDWLAAGMDPQKSIIFVQSMVRAGDGTAHHPFHGYPARQTDRPAHVQGKGAREPARTSITGWWVTRC